VGSDVFRMALAALLGIAWLVLVVRLGLVDLRRGTPIPVVLEDPQPAS
jgi:hypothetical protein